MPLHLWCAVLLISLILAFVGMKVRKRGRSGAVVWNFMPLFLALPFAALCGIALELISKDPSIMILVVPVFAAFSLLFEALLNGRERLKTFLPFFISSVIVGALMEISGLQKGYWDYPGMVSIANVILFGYVLFFYFAVKIVDTLITLVKK